MKYFKYIVLSAFILTACTIVKAQRHFQHPGITHTQADIDRMKAMIDAKREPFYSAYQALASHSTSSFNYKIRNVNPTFVGADEPDNLFTSDGHAAHNIALMWHLTGDERYAKKAVEILNNFKGITNVSNRGTMALNASKVHLLIEAAELMRDYEGWEKADQDQFKAMLVYPGYSTTTDMNHLYASLNDQRNGITWYWNAYQFDWGRHGNQETLPMRMLMGLGIYLDNDTIYERTRRYYLGLPHFEGDLPYISGPPRGMNLTPTTNCDYFEYYATPNRTFGNTSDYGYNGQLRNYVWQNGQLQETSRDQGHSSGGIGSLAHIADIAWGQGDDLYNVYDYRLLLGFEWYNRYNLSYIQSFDDQPQPWEPTGFTTNVNEATYDNGLFIRQRDRTQQWYSKRPNPTNESNDPNSISRGTSNTTISAWLMPYMHYAIRMGIDQNSTDHSDMAAHPTMLWLKRAYEKALPYGMENNGWTTDWVGWSNLTKTRTLWMTGDPCTFHEDGNYSLGIHTIEQPIRMADYDIFNREASGQGHTYYDTTTGNQQGAWRNDDVDITIDEDGQPAICNVAEGEWLSYTLRVEQAGAYQIYLTYAASTESVLGTAADGSDYKSGTLPATMGEYSEMLLTDNQALDAGAIVLRVKATGKVADDLRLRSLRIVKNKSYTFIPKEWQRTGATSTATFEETDKSITVTAPNLTVGARAQWNLTNSDYQIDSSRHYFIVKGENIRPNTIRLVSMNNLEPSITNRHYSLKAADGDSIFVWNIADDTNLSNLLTGDSFTLTDLSFFAANATGQLSFYINDVNFYTSEALQEITSSILPLTYDHRLSNKNNTVYDLRGRRLSGSQLKKGIYLIGNKKILVIP